MIIKYIAVIASMVLCTSASAPGGITEDNDTDDNEAHKMADLSNKTILMVIAPSDFRDEELFREERGRGRDSI
jgi:hypothetical protein